MVYWSTVLLMQSLRLYSVSWTGVTSGRYISKAVNIYDLLEKDRKIFDKVKQQEKHPLRNLLPKMKVTEYKYNLRHKSSHRLKLNTDRVKNSYFNRLIFKYDLAL